MTERIACCVPFCRRTTARFRPPTEWICGDHWRGVPKRLRGLYSLAKRRKKPASVLDYLWSKAKGAAIERAGGIA